MAIVDDAKNKLLICGCGPQRPGRCKVGRYLWKKQCFTMLERHLEHSLGETLERQRMLEITNRESILARIARLTREATIARATELERKHRDAGNR